ncbi:LysR family transcriptional regulator [Celerinatantimonas diazotrophica]|uniref:LysR family transcriptional regulator n=1 Tax=Celerinatantimonas diazotrophica TaxID=412034 RepID=A0A4R1KGG2_9GAMM|nr:LysR family transcriptional regulator [Celerinatantimonas diazotrophica]TCK63908.1 LysR family transcriptional regulator [Celerinatantimonas diazotrophica]CAG9296993.1 HTH-type transcriptional regulator YhaJ [Celerinatantimonas diazotrophica]
MSRYRARTTIEQWRIFQAVVHCGSYAQAAKELNKSQSSLNHAVTKLQAQLGVQLLEVRGRKTHLTSIGQVMHRRSQLLMQQVEDLEQLAHSLEEGWEPTLTIAVEHFHPKAKIYQALKQFLPHSRGTRVTIYDTVLSATEEAITEAEANLVITPELPRGVLGTCLCYSKLILVAYRQHPLAHLSQIAYDDLTQHLQLVIRDNGKHPNDSHGWLKAEQRWTLSSFSEALELLLQGLGFAWLPEHLVTDYLKSGQLVQLRMRRGAVRQFASYLVVSRPQHQGPAGALLEQLILNQYLN